MSNVWADIQDLLFAKYRHSPNILAVLEIFSSPIQDTSDAIDYILSHLSISTAEGETLDFLGELIGVTRPPAQEEDILWLCLDSEVGDDPTNRFGLAPDTIDEGGYLTGDDGIESQSDPGSYMSDTDYRDLILSKAATFRKKATRDIIYNYLIELGVRCKINESVRSAEFEPESYDSLNYWLRNYITTRGFRPAGVQITIAEQTSTNPAV